MLGSAALSCDATPVWLQYVGGLHAAPLLVGPANPDARSHAGDACAPRGTHSLACAQPLRLLLSDATRPSLLQRMPVGAAAQARPAGRSCARWCCAARTSTRARSPWRTRRAPSSTCPGCRWRCVRRRAPSHGLNARVLPLTRVAAARLAGIVPQAGAMLRRPEDASMSRGLVRAARRVGGEGASAFAHGAPPGSARAKSQQAHSQVRTALRADACGARRSVTHGDVRHASVVTLTLTSP